MRYRGESHGKYRFRFLFLLLLLTLRLFFGLHYPSHTNNQLYAASRVQVYTRRELKEELKKGGKAVIEVMETITIRESLRVKGTKILTGPGELRRAIAQNSAFGGSLLRVTGGTLTLRGITLNGRGDAEVLKGKLYGYLVSVDSGQLLIGGGSVLKMNCNTTRLSDGGGAVHVCSGGVAVLNGGSITDNACVTGGAGVRVDDGGVFSMKSGTIKNNRVVGRGAQAGFDGRGGGIYNRGTVELKGGSITRNSASEYKKGTRHYGGTGGGVANAGSLLIQGTYLCGNKGVKGKDISLIGGRTAAKGKTDIGECWIRSGSLLEVGGGFRTGGKMRIIPEKETVGTRLVSGLKGGKWKTWFSFPSSVRSDGLEPALSDGILRLRKKKVKPTPVPTPTAAPVNPDKSSDHVGTPDGGKHSGDARDLAPARTSAPRIHPSYIPVAAPDPSEDYFFGTPTPAPFVPAAPTPAPFVPAEVTPAAAPTFMPVRTFEPWRPTNALPYYYLYPPAGREGLPVEIEYPATWHFSTRDIQRLREELEEGNYGTDRELFLSKIEKNRRRESEDG